MVCKLFLIFFCPPRPLIRKRGKYKKCLYLVVRVSNRSDVKAAQYDLTQARKEVSDILEKVRNATKPDNRSLELRSATTKTVPLCRESEEYLNRWFAPPCLS